jgi:hypothetical protein
MSWENENEPKMKVKVLSEVFEKEPSGPLYHYTTQSGLLGIIWQREIWATHTQYLNGSPSLCGQLNTLRRC